MIKKVQEAMKMSHSKFLANASALEVDVDGNILRARVSLACLLSFSSLLSLPNPSLNPNFNLSPYPNPNPNPTLHTG